MHRMKFPAPAQASGTTEAGLWAYHPWTKEEVKEYREIGGWFIRGHHSFADRDAALAAGIRDE